MTRAPAPVISRRCSSLSNLSSRISARLPFPSSQTRFGHTVEITIQPAPVNSLGYLRVMFAVDDIDETLARLRKRGAQLVGDVVQYENAYRLCYIRGRAGLLIGLAEELK